MRQTKTITSEEKELLWEIEEKGFCPEKLQHNESVFTLANGRLGFRGDFEEGYPGAGEGTYLNGFYESFPIQYGELAYGYAKNSHQMVNLANPKRIRIWVDGEAFSLQAGELLGYRRTLDMKRGLSCREMRWRAGNQTVLRLKFTRMVSFADQNTAWVRLELVPERDCQLRIASCVEQSAAGTAEENDPRAAFVPKEPVLQTTGKGLGQGFYHLAQATRRSHLGYAVAVAETLSESAAQREAIEDEAAGVGFVYTLAAQAGKSVVLTKAVAFAEGLADEGAALARKAVKTAKAQAETGFEAALAQHMAALQGQWESTGLRLTGEAGLVQGMRFNVFQLFGAAGRDGKTNVPAKGLSSQGYEGHYFWDTETYVFPFFLFTQPLVAKSLLQYRHHILNAARARARELAFAKGALYTWRTIGGEECSAYYPAGTAQYHINADIAYAVGSYVEATGDLPFMRDYGLEMLVETARLWPQLGFYSPHLENQFCIHCVTGPDEYTTLVNNNTYTNLMAAHNMRLAGHWLAEMEKAYPAETKALLARLQFQPQEKEDWAQAASRMYIPTLPKENLHLQDDAFHLRVPLPAHSIPAENRPLLLHYHPLFIYRHQICKQADLVLAMLLLPGQFTKAQKKSNYEYYEPLTTHDSSLSKAVFGIIASEVGKHEEAHRFFMDTARMDLDDRHGNTKNGLHMANMAGSWMSLVMGFGGMRCQGGRLCFCPSLPKAGQLTGYSFALAFRGSRIQVSVAQGEAQYTLKSGPPLTLQHADTPFLLEGSACFPLAEAGPV